MILLLKRQNRQDARPFGGKKRMRNANLLLTTWAVQVIPDNHQYNTLAWHRSPATSFLRVGLIKVLGIQWMLPPRMGRSFHIIILRRDCWMAGWPWRWPQLSPGRIGCGQLSPGIVHGDCHELLAQPEKRKIRSASPGQPNERRARNLSRRSTAHRKTVGSSACRDGKGLTI